jgi:hypothetical protein
MWKMYRYNRKDSMITPADIQRLVPPSNLQLIINDGITQGFTGRPLKRFVRRQLAKIVKKAMKKSNKFCMVAE